MDKFLIVGLGNVGAEYANTRHNAGFIILDFLAADMGSTFAPGRYADVATARVKNKHLVLVKPSTYMNLSGKAVRYWMEKESLGPENLLVIADDLDLAPGAIRLRAKGSGGTHNGLNHIIDTLQTAEWPRMRFGIGKDYPKGMQVEYVLGRWDKGEWETLVPRFKLAADMVRHYVLAGITHTMNEFNNK